MNNLETNDVAANLSDFALFLTVMKHKEGLPEHLKHYSGRTGYSAKRSESGTGDFK